MAPQNRAKRPGGRRPGSEGEGTLMHQQVRTSPGSTDENMRLVIEALAAAGINIEGIGPDYEAPHVRVYVDHPQGDDRPLEEVVAVLRNAGFAPERRKAVTVPMPNSPGALRTAVRKLIRRGYIMESTLVLASHTDDLVRVSFGVSEGIEAGWEETSQDIADHIFDD
jgi:hypothetical protein